MVSRAEILVKKVHPVRHRFLLFLHLLTTILRASVLHLALAVACLAFGSQMAHAVVQKIVVDNYEFTWVPHENGRYVWDDVISFDEVDESLGVEMALAYLTSVPYDYSAFRRTPVSNNDLAYVERIGEPPDDEWHMMSIRYFENEVPTLDTWIRIVRGEDYLDIDPTVPIGLLTGVTAVPEPATVLLVFLSLTAIPGRIRHG
jgi:hypothetical protein